MNSAIFVASSPSSPNSFVKTPDSPNDSTSVLTVSRLSLKLARMASVWPRASFAVASVEESWSRTSDVWSISSRWLATAAPSVAEVALTCDKLWLTRGIVVPNSPFEYVFASLTASCTAALSESPACDTDWDSLPASPLRPARPSRVCCASAARRSSSSAMAARSSLPGSPAGSPSAIVRR